MTWTLAVFFLGYCSWAQTNDDEVLNQFERARLSVAEGDQQTRTTMAKLFDINERMKKLTQQKQKMTQKALAAESSSRKLTQSIRDLEGDLKDQKKVLALRLRTLYMLGEDRLARAIFSAGGSEDLDRSMKFLRIFSDSDARMIKKYLRTLAQLNQKKGQLDAELRSLLGMRKALESNEQTLNADQKSKSTVLDQLSQKKGIALASMEQLRKNLSPELQKLLDFSFFESRGRLPPPIRAPIRKTFGLHENETHSYQLVHKGLSYKSSSDKPVVAVAKGQVGYVGDLAGYGPTVILDHGDHYYSIYTGPREFLVTLGQFVDAGTRLAESTLELYFEIRHFSDALDPSAWLINGGSS
jgi:murein hydrolase activator